MKDMAEKMFHSPWQFLNAKDWMRRHRRMTKVTKETVEGTYAVKARAPSCPSNAIDHEKDECDDEEESDNEWDGANEHEQQRKTVIRIERRM